MNSDVILTKFGELPEKKCLDKGFVRLLDCMPRLLPEGYTNCDYAIAEAARCSYRLGTKKVSDDRGLIRYLMRHHHTTPFEMVSFKFHCCMPIFVARQWIRHRTASVNEMSGRYSILPRDFYVPEPDNIRMQSPVNRQGSQGLVDAELAEIFFQEWQEFSRQAYEKYEVALAKDVCREQARTILPINYYTQWYWKIDLHNLLHFLALRLDAHAQQEIRVYAQAILEMIQPIVPQAIEAWNDYHPLRQGMQLSRLEIEALKKSSYNKDGFAAPIDSENKREQKEWQAKALQMGFKGIRREE